MTDISGTWLGTYWQQGVPTRFEATFIQSGNAVTGNILDDCYLGEANLSGTLIGRNISFIKRYLTSSQTPVNYSGILAEDENYMQGHWTIGRRFSGTWEAHRTGDNLIAELKIRQADKIPVSVS